MTRRARTLPAKGSRTWLPNRRDLGDDDDDDDVVVVAFTELPGPPAAAGAAPAASDLSKHTGAVKSPMVGTAYLAPEPGKPNFVSVGDKVTAGQTLLIIEAMKTFNPIKAPKAGTVVQVLIENARPVEFGEPLMIVE